MTKIIGCVMMLMCMQISEGFLIVGGFFDMPVLLCTTGYGTVFIAGLGIFLMDDPSWLR